MARVSGTRVKGSRRSTPTPAGNGADLSRVIGGHVRAFRQQQGQTLRALSASSGLSVGFLSQLERGLTSIGLTTLRDLAHCLGHEITEFFDEQTDHDSQPNGRKSVAASTPETSADGGRECLPDKYFTLTRSSGEDTSQYISGVLTYRMLSQRAADLVLEPMLVSIAPGGRLTEQEVHDGEEFAFVISGELTFTVAGTTHVLYEGDSLHLKSSIPHRLHNATDRVTVVVSVVTPRLF